MNFFQLQNKLFYSKKDVAGDLDTEGEQSFAPFLINRWLAFYSKEMSIFTNETLNKYCGIFEEKQKMYEMYFYLIPRLRFKKITYIKKTKKEKETDKEKEEDDKLTMFAKNNHLSKRELKQYIELEKQLNK